MCAAPPTTYARHIMRPLTHHHPPEGRRRDVKCSPAEYLYISNIDFASGHHHRRHLVLCCARPFVLSCGGDSIPPLTSSPHLQDCDEMRRDETGDLLATSFHSPACLPPSIKLFMCASSSSPPPSTTYDDDQLEKFALSTNRGDNAGDDGEMRGWLLS